MLRPNPFREQERMLRLLDTRIALALASGRHDDRLRRQVHALRDRLSGQQLDRRTLAEVAGVIDALAPRRTIDGDPIAQRSPTAGHDAYRRWTRRVRPCAAGLAGLLVLFV